LLVSVSAAAELDSLEFLLDGEVLPWTSSGFDDREFYSWRGEQGLSAGPHNFTVHSKTPSTNPDIPRMICSINLHEYGNEDEFKMANDYVSAYPTWDANRVKTYRPTNEGCLMRNMTHNALCDICREGMWYEFFKTISLIDNITVTPGSVGEPSTVTLSTLRLAHLRESGNEVEGEALKIRWLANDIVQGHLEDLLEIQTEVGGDWRVEVEFVTPEVRVDPTNLLKDAANFTVPEVITTTTEGEPAATTENFSSPVCTLQISLLCLSGLISFYTIGAGRV